MSSKFDVGTIEEDFKQIGLLVESEAPAEVSEVTGDKQSTLAKPGKGKVVSDKVVAKGSKGDVQAGQDDPDAKGSDGDVQAGTKSPDAKGSDQSKKTIPLTPDAPKGAGGPEKAVGKDAATEDAEVEGEEVAEEEETDESEEEVAEGEEEVGEDGEPVTEAARLIRKRRINSKERVARRKAKVLRRRNKSKLKLKAKKFRRSPRGKRFLRKYKTALGRMHGHAPKGKRLSLKAGMDRVSNLIEEVQEIVAAIEGDSKQEAVKSFANMALIANELAENFACACDNFEVVDEDDEEIDLCGGAKHFESLAAEAARVAEGLKASIDEGVEFDGTAQEVSEMFAAMMKDVLEGTELFGELSEDSDDAEETDEDAEVEETDESDETDEDAEVAESEDDDEKDDDEKDGEDEKEKDDKKDDGEKDEDAEEDDEEEAKEGGKKKARPTK